MASLHKDPRGKSPYWYAAFLNADGKRSFKSTKRTDRDQAEEICRGWERAARQGHNGNLTEVHVRKILGEIYERTTGETIKFPTVTDFLNGRVESRQPPSPPARCEFTGTRQMRFWRQRSRSLMRSRTFVMLSVATFTMLPAAWEWTTASAVNSCTRVQATADHVFRKILVH